MTKLLTAPHDPLPLLVPGWNTLDPDTRSEIREAYARKQSSKLINAYGFDSDSDLTDNMRYGDGSERETR